MADQQQQLLRRLIEEHRVTPHPGLTEARLRLHASIHAVVESQLVAGEPPAVRTTLERLEAQGLDRHEAVHAIGSVVAREMMSALRAHYDEARFVAALAELSAARWRSDVAGAASLGLASSED